MTVVETRPSEQTQAKPEAFVASLSDISEADRGAWRDLLADYPESAPFIDEDWVAAWSSGFGPREPLLVGSREGGRLAGIGALQSLRESWAGRRTTVLQSLTSVESSRFEFLSAGRRSDVQERLWTALCDPQRWDVIRLDRLPENSPTIRAGMKVAADLGWNRVLEPILESPWRTLPRPPATWDDGLKRKFRANLRNRERRLEALGEVTFAVTGAGTDLHALETFYALEARGWKGELGTAITRQAQTKVFYDGLLQRTAHAVWIPILSVGGRAAAAQLIRVHDRTLFLLKTAYDPEFAPYSPGHLITARLIRYGMERGMAALDFLGADMPWKQDWEPRLRSHFCLSLFAPSAGGRYAYWTRHGARETAKRIPGAVRLVQWLRARQRRP